MCDNCERKDRVIDSLKESVLKQARLETIRELYKDTKIKQKEKIIESMVNSNLDIEFIRDHTNAIKQAQGIHGHYS